MIITKEEVIGKMAVIHTETIEIEMIETETIETETIETETIETEKMVKITETEIGYQKMLTKLMSNLMNNLLTFRKNKVLM